MKYLLPLHFFFFLQIKIYNYISKCFFICFHRKVKKWRTKGMNNFRRKSLILQWNGTQRPLNSSKFPIFWLVQKRSNYELYFNLAYCVSVPTTTSCTGTEHSAIFVVKNTCTFCVIISFDLNTVLINVLQIRFKHYTACKIIFIIKCLQESNGWWEASYSTAARLGKGKPLLLFYFIF